MIGASNEADIYHRRREQIHNSGAPGRYDRVPKETTETETSDKFYFREFQNKKKFIFVCISKLLHFIWNMCWKKAYNLLAGIIC